MAILVQASKLDFAPPPTVRARHVPAAHARRAGRAGSAAGVRRPASAVAGEARRGFARGDRRRRSGGTHRCSDSGSGRACSFLGGCRRRLLPLPTPQRWRVSAEHLGVERDTGPTQRHVREASGRSGRAQLGTRPPAFCATRGRNWRNSIHWQTEGKQVLESAGTQRGPYAAAPHFQARRELLTSGRGVVADVSEVRIGPKEPCKRPKCRDGTRP